MLKLSLMPDSRPVVCIPQASGGCWALNGTNPAVLRSKGRPPSLSNAVFSAAKQDDTSPDLSERAPRSLMPLAAFPLHWLAGWRSDRASNLHTICATFQIIIINIVMIVVDIPVSEPTARNNIAPRRRQFRARARSLAAWARCDVSSGVSGLLARARRKPADERRQPTCKTRPASGGADGGTQL